MIRRAGVAAAVGPPAAALAAGGCPIDTVVLSRCLRPSHARSLAVATPTHVVRHVQVQSRPARAHALSPRGKAHLQVHVQPAAALEPLQLALDLRDKGAERISKDAGVALPWRVAGCDCVAEPTGELWEWLRELSREAGAAGKA